MNVALINPCWTYDGRIYFDCRSEPLPLELAYARIFLENEGHEVLMLDGQILGLDNAALAERVARFDPAMTVVTTAPTYLFWHCATPELRVPADFLSRLGGRGGRSVAVGPHGSATPAPVLRKLSVDLVVRGECEEVVATLAALDDWSEVPGTAAPSRSHAALMAQVYPSLHPADVEVVQNTAAPAPADRARRPLAYAAARW